MPEILYRGAFLFIFTPGSLTAKNRLIAIFQLDKALQRLPRPAPKGLFRNPPSLALILLVIRIFFHFEALEGSDCKPFENGESL